MAEAAASEGQVQYLLVAEAEVSGLEWIELVVVTVSELVAVPSEELDHFVKCWRDAASRLPVYCLEQYLFVE